MENEKKYASLETLRSFKENADKLYATKDGLENSGMNFKTDISVQNDNCSVEILPYAIFLNDTDSDTYLCLTPESIGNAMGDFTFHPDDSGGNIVTDNYLSAGYLDFLRISDGDTSQSGENISISPKSIQFVNGSGETVYHATGIDLGVKEYTFPNTSGRLITQEETDVLLQSKASTNHNHDDKYDAKGSSAEALTQAKSYADTAIRDLYTADMMFSGDVDFDGNLTYCGIQVATIDDIPDYITTGAKSGTTIGACATAEGYDTTSSGDYAHAEGYNAKASGFGSHAEGSSTSSGDYAHAEGYDAKASGFGSHASGYKTTALDYQFVLGKYNNADTTSIAGVAGVSSPDSQSSDETLFVVGYGTSTTNGNAFRIAANGKCRGVSTFTASGADFAELFEWVDGNPDNEDRRGLFVTLDGEKIKIANNGDDYIGVISGAEAFLGNSASEEWQGKYLTDVFGTRLVQTVEIPAKIDEVTNEVITPAHTVTQYVLNPDYNPNKQYIMRENRKEWGMVGLLGQVVVIDDGTCVVGGYVKPSADGIGTASDNGYRVMKRIDENHIKVLVK